MPYMQCPFCDSFHVKEVAQGEFKCKYCGRIFVAEHSDNHPLPSFNY